MSKNAHIYESKIMLFVETTEHLALKMNGTVKVYLHYSVLDTRSRLHHYIKKLNSVA
jgi:hypothetical protein